MSEAYDTIGVNYANLRRPDRRIAAVIREALGDARSVLNVGAGTGSFEPRDCSVTAVEPSVEMIRQRAADAAPAIQARAEALPFEDDSFDASMAVLTVHHWTDQALGLREMRRVTRGRIVILTYDPAFRGFWLTRYIPELTALDDAQMPPIDEYDKWIGPVTVSAVPIPHDCTDGFLCAYWRRPEAYLNPKVRAAISSFWALGDISPALDRLRSDIASGRWTSDQREIIGKEALDCGYRLIVSQEDPAREALVRG